MWLLLQLPASSCSSSSSFPGRRRTPAQLRLPGKSSCESARLRPQSPAPPDGALSQPGTPRRAPSSAPRALPGTPLRARCTPMLPARPHLLRDRREERRACALGLQSSSSGLGRRIKGGAGRPRAARGGAAPAPVTFPLSARLARSGSARRTFLFRGRAVCTPRAGWLGGGPGPVGSRTGAHTLGLKQGLPVLFTSNAVSTVLWFGRPHFKFLKGQWFYL